jgi:hypothetical protein
MDRQIDSLLATLGLAFIFYYNRFTNIATPYVLQAQKSLEALRKSFAAAGVYCFYDGVPTPVYLGDTMNSTDENAEKPRWYFISENNVFLNDINNFNSNSELKQFPWLSADIICDGSKVADISDFVMNLRYCGELPPTPDVILSLWCFNKQYLLRRSQTQLVVICSEADTHTFNFSPTGVDDTTWRRSLGLVSVLSSADQ